MAERALHTEPADSVHVDVCPDCGTASTGHHLDPPGHCPHEYECRVPVLYVPLDDVLQWLRDCGETRAATQVELQFGEESDG